MGILRSLLPEKDLPLQPNGNGIQSVYLSQVPVDFAKVLTGLIGSEAEPIRTAASHANAELAVQAVNADVELWEHHLQAEVEGDPRIPETERKQLITARQGQAAGHGC